MCLCIWNGRLVSGSADETVKVWEFDWQKERHNDVEPNEIVYSYRCNWT